MTTDPNFQSFPDTNSNQFKPIQTNFFLFCILDRFIAASKGHGHQAARTQKIEARIINSTRPTFSPAESIGAEFVVINPEYFDVY